MKILSIDKNNIEQEHICCALGNDKKNKRRAISKKNWLKERFDDGLIFKRLDDRGKIFIEYMPIEKVWKPVIGKNIMFINCLWVSGKFKGMGISSKFLNECINEAKEKDMNGVAVVSANKVKPFLTDKKFFLHNGFEVVDTAEPYFELLFLKFDSKAENPSFTNNSKKAICANKVGFEFIYSNQCPFMEEYSQLLSDIAKKYNIPFHINKLQNYKEVQEMGSPFGTLGIYYNGNFITHELLSEKKFEKFINSIELN